jgi:hypothetical protein
MAPRHATAVIGPEFPFDVDLNLNLNATLDIDVVAIAPGVPNIGWRLATVRGRADGRSTTTVVLTFRFRSTST